MEKLIELLNEYEEQKKKETGLRAYEWESYGDGHLIQATNIVTKGKKTPLALIESRSLLKSKDYGFIERLVENDKIDFNKINYPLRYNSYYPDRFGIVSTSVNDYEEYLRVGYDRCETLLMLLAISDTPIENLVSYLK